MACSATEDKEASSSNQLKKRTSTNTPFTTAATTTDTACLLSSSCPSSSCSVCLSTVCSCAVATTTEVVGSMRRHINPVLCVCGIYVFFMSFAFAQEHIYLVPASADVPKFTYSIFLVFIMCISNALISYLYLLLRQWNTSQQQRTQRHEKQQVPDNSSDSSSKIFSLTSGGPPALSVSSPPHSPSSPPSLSSCHIASSSFCASCSSFSRPTLTCLAAPLSDLLSSRHLRRELLLTSISYVLAMVATNYALTHVNYPTQVMVKSAKMVPVVVGGFMVFSKTYPWYDYVSVVLVTTAIGIFNFLGSSKSRTSSTSPSPHIPTGVTDDVPDADDVPSSSPTLVSSAPRSDAGTTSWGLVLLCVSLVCDGLTGPRLDKINGKYKQLSSAQIMCFVNIYAVLIAGVCMLLFEGIGGIAYALTTPSTFYLFCIFCFSATMGQFCIFFGLRIFGSLYLTFITTTRKFFTVIFSVLWFEHHMTNTQWLCMFLVFSSLTLQSCFSKSDKMQKRKVAETAGERGPDIKRCS
eukprot:GHVS01053398.1.p1 GENE.GHVS01053398.1~~GHVS01053398.1.p1  ORF type:complete len:522 (-),score=70.41 GHVS01053398.1:490-2055(-)